ncbi:CRF1 Copper resistance protein CRF1 [Candida maltosa Xu316]
MNECIRGHRVTTCTHTNEPLTMIKPKGRPATQCQHCRDNRKQKNLHVACSCGKKGKNGTHTASCACYKTNHCTCSTGSSSKKSGVKGDIHHMTPSEKAKKKSLIDAANADLKKKSDTSDSASNTSDMSPSSITSPNKKQETPQLSQPQKHSPKMQQPNQIAYNSLSNQNFVIEDVVIPFTTTANGLFDLFSSNAPSEVGANDSQINLSNLGSNDSTPVDGHHNDKSTKNDLDFPLSPQDSEANPIFPLFPLVGTQSFDNEDQPLSAVKRPQQPIPMRPSTSSVMQNMNSNSYSSLPSAVETSSISQYQSRPKRPESVLSIASNSSTRSFDFFGNSHNNNHASSFLNGSLPTSSTSAAYPPSNGFDESNLSTNSNDDHNMQHHFGRTGLGSSKFGTQLSKIESEMYTDNFFDDPYSSNGQPDISGESSIPNLYNVPESNGSTTFNDNNNNNISSNETMDNMNNNYSQLQQQPQPPQQPMPVQVSNQGQFYSTPPVPNMYDVHDIISDPPFDMFFADTLQSNGKAQKKEV